MDEKAVLKARLLNRLIFIISECGQTIRDMEYWNGLPHNQSETPIDVEYFRVSRAWAIKQLEALERKDGE